jgi:nucleoid DNA-binding protein
MSRTSLPELVEQLRATHGLTATETRLVVSEVVSSTNMLIVGHVIDCIKDSLIRRNEVKLRGIGTLSIYTKAASTYRHPTTGKLRETKAKRYVRFKVSRVFVKEL